MPFPTTLFALHKVFKHGLRARLQRAWQIGIILCGVTAPLLAAPQPEAAQPDITTSTGSPAARSLEPPSPEESMALYRTVESWIRRWDVPTASKDPVSAPPAGRPFVAAAAITLRHEHRIVGRGKAFASTPSDTGVLAAAVLQAMDEVERRRPVSADALGQRQRLTEAADLTVSLELAGELVPFEPSTFAEVDLAVQSGLEGLAARIGNQLSGVFPSAMLLAGGSAADAACAAISEASNDPMLAIKNAQSGQPAALAKSHGLRLYRFRISHVAQPARSAQPAFLIRSGRTVTQRDITTESLVALQTLIAANLRDRLVSTVAPVGAEVLKVIGPYSASRGSASAAEASPESAALVALAMRLHAETLPIDSPDRTDFDLLGGELALAAMRARTPMSPVTAAGVVACVAAECATDSDARTTFEPAFGVLLGSMTDALEFAPGIPMNSRGLFAYAFAREARSGGALEAATPFRQRANAAIVAVLKETSTTSMTAAMPWIFLADRELGAPDTAEGRLPRTGAFIAFRDSLWKMQLTADDAGEDGPDLVGGFAFLDPRSPLPTAAAVPVVAFLAACLADTDATTDAERMPELVRLLRSARFVRQLTIDEWSAYSAAAPESAIGGVRWALWDDTLDPDVQAHALVAVINIRRAIGVSARNAATESLKPAP